MNWPFYPDATCDSVGVGSWRFLLTSQSAQTIQVSRCRCPQQEVTSGCAVIAASGLIVIPTAHKLARAGYPQPTIPKCDRLR